LPPTFDKEAAMLDGATVHTTLPAMDMERAAEFYTKKVGATTGDSAQGGSFFSVGDSQFTLYPTPNPNRGGHTQMGLRVPDVRAAVAELRSRGIVFEEYDVPGLKTVDGVADLGGVSAAWFKDTEDNIIGVVQFGA
jgi:predicted enzyme related to lactoylglutathione lyase